MDEDRIEQFRKMAKANPDDDLAHFVLGQALLDADRHAEATMVLRHVLKLNSGFSKAYVLLGEAHEGVGDIPSAVATWQQGYQAAMNRGELMPASAMKEKLRAHGAELPDLVSIGEAGAGEPVDDGREPGEGELRDARTGRVGDIMRFDPFPDDPVGAWIYGHISQESWDAWMEMSTKIINELRLDLADPEAQRTYDLHMKDFLLIPEALFEGKEYG